MTSTVNELLWLRWLLTDLDASQDQLLFIVTIMPLVISLTIQFFMNAQNMLKGIAILFVSVWSPKKFMSCAITTTNQIAYIFTKPCRTTLFRFLLHKMAIHDLNSSSRGK